jgi:tripartite-type tricarboxylate transporter receptor subunit TctC
MRFATTRRGLLGGGAAALAGAGGGAAAQPLDRTARMLCGWPPGGAADLIARIYADRLRGYAPQVVVDNRPGAAARLGLEAAKAAAPDGATMVMTPETMLTIYPHIYPRTLRYDPLRDFIPVSALCSTAFAFAVASHHPARSLEEFVAWSRGRGEVPYASPAAGSTPHFIAERMGKALGVGLQHVSYRGTGPAIPDLEAGRLAAVISVVGEFPERQRRGQVRVLAVSAPQRAPSLPEAATLAELGLPELTFEEWYGMLLPAGTPPASVEALHRAIEQAAAHPEARAQLERIDQRPFSCTPEQFAGRIRGEIDRWGPIVRQTGYRAEE